MNASRVSGNQICRCLRAVPWWDVLGWILYSAATTLLLTGATDMFDPTDIYKADDVATAHEAVATAHEAGTHVSLKLGLVTTSGSIIGVVCMINMMMTERTIAHKLGLHYGSCQVPCYGLRYCIDGKHAKSLQRLSATYLSGLLAASWLNIILSILLVVLALIVSTLFMAIGATVHTLGGDQAEEGVIAMMGVLNEEPLQMGINTTDVAQNAIIIVVQNPKKIIKGGATAIVGAGLFAFAEAIFLSSFSMTYGAWSEGGPSMKQSATGRHAAPIVNRLGVEHSSGAMSSECAMATADAL